MTYTIRKALVSESQYLWDLALRSKAHWGYSPEFIEQCRPHIKIDPEYVENWPVVLLEEDGEIKGFYSLKAIRGENRLDNLWIDPKFIKYGYGKKLLIHAMETAKGLGWDHFTLASEPNAV